VAGGGGRASDWRLGFAFGGAWVLLCWVSPHPTKKRRLRKSSLVAAFHKFEYAKKFDGSYAI
ncbi:hypothetical protein, partial [Xanthomonas phaseoli]|uniref:hypothetical protein n=1 Tax=Xanthomonas phaseoli TaxID=1985254 RepID=UPI001E4C9F81